MATAAKDQLALDERQIEDSTLEGLLEARLQAQQDKAEVGGVFKKADEAAKAAVALLKLADEDVVRVGRFRITRTIVAGHHVDFDTESSPRVRISLADGPDKPKRAARTGRGGLRSISPDDVDLRPTGEVNADALRGEADRSVVH